MAWDGRFAWLESASRRQRWLVGVSGGADSVALLHLLVDAGFGKLVVCHLDHQLRGRASTGDARFVESLASRLKLQFELGRAPVADLAAGSGDSVETAARQARHTFFAECAQKHRCSRVLLAHHADDQAETVLWNLIRGSHGLKGMKERQRLRTGSGKVLEFYRPLLSIRGEHLREWLVERKLRWRDDSTNAEAIAIRNRLRNEAIPLLTDIAGREVVPALARGAQASAELEEIADWAVAKAAAVDPQGRLHVPALLELPPALQAAAIHRYLAAHGICGLDRKLVERARMLLDPTSSPAVNLPGGKALRRRARRLVIE